MTMKSHQDARQRKLSLFSTQVADDDFNKKIF